ncbi:hypothetical protein QA641_44290 [Bradyrhizobium sp. CB1650]|uniref:hypothetical protein n=1 Tax=Bradyrhizobium sp. CB1650 TaxID=3039153 RepID=UPI002434BB13|nr:hypothetical protein [Bradyrhizobium sp. CB1650]WGD52339.1 hypothetical protein QA641_44290 [Bradyrhizobium sp. CB1650]
MLGAADQALYAAKRLGRKGVICAEQILAEFARLDREMSQVPAPAARKSAEIVAARSGCPPLANRLNERSLHP